MVKKNKQQSNEQKLRELALNDVVMQQMFSVYDTGVYSSFEDFLTDTVLVMSSVKNALHDRILEDATSKNP